MQTLTLLAGVERVVAFSALHASSISTPKNARRWDTFCRTGGLCSPIPPANTSRSSPSQDSGIGRHGLRHAPAEDLDRKLSLCVIFLCVLQELAHIGRSAAKRPQPGIMVQHSLQRIRIHLPITQQVQQHTGVEITAAGSHGYAPGRRQPHGCIDGFAVLHRGHARAAAEMRQHNPAREFAAKLVHDGLIRQTMKAVAAPYARVEKIAGQSEARSGLRQRAMKGCIQAGELRRARGTPAPFLR